MNSLDSQSTLSQNQDPMPDETYDYSNVDTTARIAFYDDLRSAPRITTISPAPTLEYIEALATTTYDQAKSCGGLIPYTIIKEVSENFIHARFKEITVSIFDGGNTIRFADQGPGITQKEKAQLPGFSSAIEPMKKYIRGVGSGLPIVKEYLKFSNGTIYIEDNMDTGTVVTISVMPNKQHEQMSYSQETSLGDHLYKNVFSQATSQNQFEAYELARIRMAAAPLSQRDKNFLLMLLDEGSLGITELSKLTETPVSTTHHTLTKLEEAGLVECVGRSKRLLTPLGRDVAASL